MRFLSLEYCLLLKKVHSYIWEAGDVIYFNQLNNVQQILDTILTDAYGMDETEFSSFAKSRGSMDDIKKLLQLTGIAYDSSYILPIETLKYLCLLSQIFNFCILFADTLKGKQATMNTHLKVLGCLTFTDKEKMSLIFDSYKDCWDFFRFDEDPNADFSMKVRVSTWDRIQSSSKFSFNI
jgi:hypothetical protein